MQTVMLRVTHRGFIRNLQCFLFSSQPEQIPRPEICKVVNVAILGSPNSGKSTLINKICERKICATSKKVHTTTKMARAMCYHEDTQIIFLDTPGIVTKKEQRKYNLPMSMIRACEKSLRCANVIGVVHDVSNRWTRDRIHKDIIMMLEAVPNIPAFLILNKVDQLKSKHQILLLIHTLCNGFISGKRIPGPKRGSKIENKKEQKGYSKFSDVFIVSALQGDGVLDIKNYLANNAKPASLQYCSTVVTDQEPEELIEQTVRAKFMDYLAQEIPYNLKIQIEYFDDSIDDKIICSVEVECPSERLVKLISGAGGGRLQQIKTDVRNDLIEVFRKSVQITFNLIAKKVPKD